MTLERLTTDVVVAGAGMAGTAAAIEAAAAGCDVVLLEKDASLGGNAKWAGGFDIEEPTYERMRVTQSAGDPKLQQVLVARFHPDVEWLRTLGVRLVESTPGRFDFYPRQGEGGIRAFVTLAAHLMELGCDVRLNSSLVRLRTDELDGVGGVVARIDGSLAAIHARAVVVATGSFARSAELKLRYIGPNGDRTGYYGTEYHDGDGVTAALLAGATLSSGVSIPTGGCVFAPPFSPGGDSYELGVTGLIGSEPVPAGIQNLMYRSPAWGEEPVVLVNLHGRRYVDESAPYTVIGWKTTQQPEGVGFCIFDERVHSALRRILDGAVSCGAALYSDDTVRGLAALLREWRRMGTYAEGVSTGKLLATIEEFNRAVDAGATNELDPPRRKNIAPLRRPPYFAAPVVQGVVDVAGGIRIDATAHALDCTGTPIPGLYVAGADAGRVYTVDHGGLAFALVFGRIAGAAAAHFAQQRSDTLRVGN